MALTSSRLPFLPRVREGRHLRRYRQYLLEDNILAHSAPLLAHLDRLPLRVQPQAGGAAVPLIEAAQLAPRIRLVSPPSPGRELILRQLCLRWAQGQPIQQTFPVLYNLHADCDQSVMPLQIIQREFARLGFEHDDLTLKRGIAAGLWLFLLDGWDTLGCEAQARWAGWLKTCADRYPAMACVVVTGPQPAWPGFEDWAVADWAER
ncbi:MAG TPA: hypothetical protein VD886_09110 [Herpetosiphonaceae bacterium]|nr:hypothetical protein [Herpetosiphonaceae bacterium]